MKRIILAAAIAFTASAALAQNAYYYGSNGSYQGTSNRVGNQTYYYGGNGAYQGSSSNVGNQTYYYGSNGAYQGSRSRY